MWNADRQLLRVEIISIAGEVEWLLEVDALE